MKVWQDKRLRLAITRLGAEYLAALVLVGGFAVNTGNNLLYLVFSMMLGLFLVSGWVSRRAIRGLDLAGIEEGNLFARVQGGIRVRLEDRAPGRMRALEVRLEMEGAAVEPGFLPGGDRAATGPVLVLQARPERRGPARLRRLEVCTRYPFGFLEKAWSFPLDRTVLILPHPRAYAPARTRGGDRLSAGRRPGSTSPDGARPFKERDPLSRVHWKRTAQRGEPWVRTFEDDPPEGIRLRLDLREWQPGPAFEQELERLSGGVLQARLRRVAVALRVEGAGGGRDYQGCDSCWRALALAEPGAMLSLGGEAH